MRLVTAAEMRRIDEAAINEYGIPGLVLMENAGRSVAFMARKMLGKVKGRKIVVFAGKGNNGGDGLVAARHLSNWGAEVKVVLLSPVREISGDAATNLSIWLKMNRQIYALSGIEDLNAIRLMLVNTDLVIDAIFGTGFKGRPREPVASLIETINAAGKPVLAVDIPSGLEVDSGQVRGPCIRATCTLTFGLPKCGCLVYPGRGWVGELYVADISLPGVLLEENEGDKILITPSWVRQALPVFPPTTHKGERGRVLVVAGSRGMVGAACLAALGALRSGAGLVTLALPQSVQPVAAAKLTEIMTVPLAETESGSLAWRSLRDLLMAAEKADAVAIGPGLTTHPETCQLVKELVAALRQPVVLDADGLNAVAPLTGRLRSAGADVVLTPHPGEMSRLLGSSSNEVQEDRLRAVRQAAALAEATVVLKGASTLIADRHGRILVNVTGNQGMATGGSGDVLSGIIAALLAQKIDGWRAAGAAVLVHGWAGDLAARECGYRGMAAGDLIDYLPRVWRWLEMEIKEAEELPSPELRVYPFTDLID